jgi:hypothetical protein
VVRPIESEDWERPSNKPGSLWFIWVFLSFLIYILSIGPAVKFGAPFWRPRRTLEVIYARWFGSTTNANQLTSSCGGTSWTAGRIF